MRVDVKPSLQVRFSHERYASPAAWKAPGVDLTYEEKELLNSIGGKDLTLGELMKIVEMSSLGSKETLLGKLKKVPEKMGR